MKTLALPSPPKEKQPKQPDSIPSNPGVDWSVFPRTSYPDDADMICDHTGFNTESGRCNKCGRNVLKP